MDIWYSIKGRKLERLQSDSRFPDKPDATKELENMASPLNFGDNYGLKLTSYFLVRNCFYLIQFSMLCCVSGITWSQIHLRRCEDVQFVALKGGGIHVVTFDTGEAFCCDVRYGGGIHAVTFDTGEAFMLRHLKGDACLDFGFRKYIKWYYNKQIMVIVTHYLTPSYFRLLRPERTASILLVMTNVHCS